MIPGELARCCGKVECFPDARKHAALGHTTGVTLIDYCPQRGNLAGVFVAATPDLLQEAVAFSDEN
jgi:hypothetical protein